MFRWISIAAVFTLASFSMTFAQESSDSVSTLQQPVAATLPIPKEPPAPGPELLKYTTEQIEAAYEGKEMPEAVVMYLVIAKGGQLDGTNGWFGPAKSRFSWRCCRLDLGRAP